METDNFEIDNANQAQFSYEEIPGRNQGVVYCHWPITFKAYFFIRDIRLGKFLLLPEHKNHRTTRLVEKMRSWFQQAYIQPRSASPDANIEKDNLLVTGAS